MPRATHGLAEAGTLPMADALRHAAVGGPVAAADAAVRLLAAVRQRRIIGLLLGGSAFFVAGPILGLAGSPALLAGFGIANEKRWGYFLAVALTGLDVAALRGRRRRHHRGHLVAGADPARLHVALFALLLHPQSRDYQRIWFK